MRTVRQWLEQLGLPQYAEVFERNAVDLDLLCDLTDEDLEKVGVHPLGHRKKLLRAIAELNRSLAVAPTAQPIQVSPPPPQLISAEAERRQLTVMFCDLVGSTALSERLDPEDLREAIQSYQHAAADVIARFDGHIAQYLGDGLLVYFGFPQAHEDDAQRAVRAGLGIVDRLQQITTRVGSRDVHLAVRVGIDTGLVVVGDVGGGARQERLALGETPNVGARLQALAEPDTVVISAATQRLVQGAFVLRDLGHQKLKGVSAPVAVFQVLGESGVERWLGMTAAAGLTPLVGRKQEVALLIDRWERACRGDGQVVALIGEPGIGKSRLLRVVRDRAAGGPHQRLECRCSPYYQHTPLYPVTELLPRILEWGQEETPEGKLAKLEHRLADYRVALTEVTPLLAALFALPPSERYPLRPMSPQLQKQKTLEAIVAVLLAMAAVEPVLLIFEDLHWIDPTSLELLTLLLDQAPTACLLILLTARPTFHPPWPARAHLSQLTLTRFPRKQTELMVSRVAGGKALPGEVVQQIVAKTDGVPLFVEELTKMVLESGLLRERDDHFELTGPLPPLAIPSTLQDSLMARLDRLAPVKEVAQLGATLGRAFSYELIRAVSSLDDATLEHEIGRLVGAELLYQRGVPPKATYTFKHAMVQETAYHSLLKSTRQRYHQRIAQVLVERFVDLAGTRPEFVAHHFTEAGLSHEAAEYWQRAGQLAVRRSAHAEALAHFGKALEVLATCPESVERDQLELALQVGLGYAVVPTKGWAASEVERVFTRARVLSQRVPQTPLLFGALWGLAAFHAVRADHHTSEEFTQQCAALAERTQNPDLLVEAYGLQGWAFYWVGEFGSARGYLERSIGLYDRERHSSHAFLYGQDPCVSSLLYLSWTLWPLGYAEQALLRVRECLAHARELSHPFSLAWALHACAMTHSSLREWAEVQAALEENTRLSSEQGFPLFIAWATVFRGLVLAKQGQFEPGTTQAEQALRALQAGGCGIATPFLLCVLAEAFACAARIDEGLNALAEALTLVETTGERFHESEIRRLKGELLLMRAGPDEPQAEACFIKSIEVARAQKAKGWELRASTSLARLWQGKNKRREAHDLLAPVYMWFTEGFDTKDLKEAKALLEQLG